MKDIIIYHSNRWGNTKKIVDRIGKTTGIEVISDKNLNDIDLSTYGKIGFASGIYMGKPSRSIINLIFSLKKKTKVFLILTSGDPKGKHYLDNFEEKLSSLGLEVIGGFWCPGVDKLFFGIPLNKGRPNENDLSEAEAFGKMILEESEPE